MLCQLPQGTFHRVAQRFAIDKAQRVASSSHPQQFGRQRTPGVAQCAIGKHLLDAHAVLRERAGFVGTNHRGAAQGFDRRQMPHQRIAPRHALGCHGQRQRHGRQQPFGHVGDDDANGKQQIAPERQAHRLPDKEKRQPQHACQQGHQVRQAGNLALQWRDAGPDGLRQMGYLAKFRMHAGGKHHCPALAGHHQRASQQQVARAQGRCIRVGFGVARLGQRLAGQGGQIHPQVKGFDQPAVGRHLVAFAEQQHIAWHQQFGGQRLQDRITQHVDLLRQQPAQGIKRLLGPVGLPERKNPVDQDHADDCNAQLGHALTRLAALGKPGQARRHPQDQRKKVGELPAKTQPQRFTRHRFNPV